LSALGARYIQSPWPGSCVKGRKLGLGNETGLPNQVINRQFAHLQRAPCVVLEPLSNRNKPEASGTQEIDPINRHNK
jgi:hypothetical protein